MVKGVGSRPEIRIVQIKAVRREGGRRQLSRKEGGQPFRGAFQGVGPDAPPQWEGIAFIKIGGGGAQQGVHPPAEARREAVFHRIPPFC